MKSNLKHNQLTISYPNNGKTMDINHELFLINRDYGISKSKFAVKAIEEKIQKIKKIKTNSIL